MGIYSVYAYIGCPYSALPYFDPVRMTIIDGMHNIFLGSVNYFIRKILILLMPLIRESFKLFSCMKRLQYLGALNKCQA